MQREQGGLCAIAIRSAYLNLILGKMGRSQTTEKKETPQIRLPLALRACITLPTDPAGGFAAAEVLIMRMHFARELLCELSLNKLIHGAMQC